MNKNKGRQQVNNFLIILGINLILLLAILLFTFNFNAQMEYFAYNFARQTPYSDFKDLGSNVYSALICFVLPVIFICTNLALGFLIKRRGFLEANNKDLKIASLIGLLPVVLFGGLQIFFLLIGLFAKAFTNK